jgi:alpha-tubulin suppressor-like RCC1 family protein
MCVSEDGIVFTWGKGNDGKLGHGDEKDISVPSPIDQSILCFVVQLAGGFEHSLALTLKREVFSWGWGHHGQLGHGDDLSLHSPKLIQKLADKSIREISCGSFHSAAVTGMLSSCFSLSFSFA